jgi:hypothetical protein
VAQSSRGDVLTPDMAFLAVPLTIVILVTMTHLFPPDESKLPD